MALGSSEWSCFPTNSPGPETDPRLAASCLCCWEPIHRGPGRGKPCSCSWNVSSDFPKVRRSGALVRGEGGRPFPGNLRLSQRARPTGQGLKVSLATQPPAGLSESNTLWGFFTPRNTAWKLRCFRHKSKALSAPPLPHSRAWGTKPRRQFPPAPAHVNSSETLTPLWPLQGRSHRQYRLTACCRPGA